MRIMIRKDPFQRMRERMEEVFESMKDLETVFDGIDEPAVGGRMPVDIEEHGEELVLRADLPGIEKDHINITATTDRIEIRADDTRSVETEDEHVYRRERRARQYYRTIALPTPVDPDSAEATYENGVLTVRMTTTGEQDGRSVDVN